MISFPPSNATETLLKISAAQTPEHQLVGVILYICANRPRCKHLWGVCWDKEGAKYPWKLVELSKYKEVAVQKMCEECKEKEGWVVIDEATEDAGGVEKEWAAI